MHWIVVWTVWTAKSFRSQSRLQTAWTSEIAEKEVVRWTLMIDEGKPDEVRAPDRHQSDGRD